MSEENSNSESQAAWYETALPEGLRDIPFLKDTKSPDEFVGNLKNASQHMGNSLRIPGPDAGDQDWSSFDAKLAEKIPHLVRADLTSDEGKAALLKRLGLPDSADEYGADGESKWLAEAALKANLTKSQFNSLVKNVAELNEQQGAVTNAERQEQLDSLFKEWGFSKAKRLENIEGLAKLTDAPDSLRDQIASGTMDANTLRWLDSLASQFAESQNFAQDRNDPSGLSVEEAHAQVQELLNNPALFENSDYGRTLQRKMVELQELLNPE